MPNTTRQRFPGDTPVSQRRLTQDIPAHRIDAQLKRSLWCIWPDCTQPKLDGSMICHLHVAECAELVYSLRDLPPTTVDARELDRAAFQQKFINESDKRRAERDAKYNAEIAANVAALERGEKIVGLTPRTHVYFLRVGDLIKIGYSGHVYQRLRDYPPNTEILGIFPGTKKVEADLHGRFRYALRKGREWYRPAQEILDYIDDMIDHYGPPDITDIYSEPGARPVVGGRLRSGATRIA